MELNLLGKYNIPGPRYTSYPTVPYWQTTPPAEKTWLKLVNESLSISNEEEGISIYIHLPYCESLCTYCGCNKRITVNHKVELPYIETVLAEWEMYIRAFEKAPVIRDIHLGGGTPTFFSPENLQYLIEGIVKKSVIHPEARFGFEAHPGNTTDQHLQTLYNNGFRRISIGVQDFNQKVLLAIHRYQTYEEVAHLSTKAREIGFNSVNYDLIYGLPHQSVESMKVTLEKVVALRPDRIAFYSYAHIPANIAAQNSFPVESLPYPETKLAIYDAGKTMLQTAGYHEIGMDHFSLPTDEIYLALQNGTLHRNFMGYTENNTRLLIGLGVSAISDSWNGFLQNEKTIEAYKKRVSNNELPIHKGHELSGDDLIIRRHILNIMTTFRTTWLEEDKVTSGFAEAIERLGEMEEDGLVKLMPFSLEVTEKGRSFVRNVCMAFDEKLWGAKPLTPMFSKTI